MGAAAAVGAIAAARRHSLSRPMRSYVPGSEKYIFTSSRDGADALGCEDHAIGAADRTDDLQRAAKKVLTSYWRHQVDEWDQGRWESCIQEGLIGDRKANAWAEGGWHLTKSLMPNSRSFSRRAAASECRCRWDRRGLACTAARDGCSSHLMSCVM